MFTSDKERALKGCLLYGCAALFFAVLGFVYELFSHEVYSYYMIYAFMIPVCLGIIPYLRIYHFGYRLPSAVFTQMYASGIMTLTAGSAVRGVLDIYGTTSSLLMLYLYAGLLLCGAGAAGFAYCSRSQTEKSRITEQQDPA
ncbi:MAG: hypothetical protein IKF00_03610 [Solobacterium sp.]|nr:hypothetical protein [Solobacterium sp.]